MNHLKWSGTPNIHFQMPNRNALNLECVFALKKNWPVTFAVELEVALIGNWYGLKKVICLAQLNSTSEVRFPFVGKYLIRYTVKICRQGVGIE